VPRNDRLALAGESSAFPMDDAGAPGVTAAACAPTGNSAFRARLDEFLPHQLRIVVEGTTMALTGDGELGFDSGEGA